MPRELKTIVLAAGKGTRMKSDQAKVLHPIWGRPLIDYVLETARAAGSKQAVVVLGHQKEEVEAHLGGKHRVVHQTRMVGTADAVRCTEPVLKSFRGDVLILCGDTPLLRPETLKALVRKHRTSQAACTFLTAVVHNNAGYGRIIRQPGGSVAAIREEKDATGIEREIREINVGVYCLGAADLFKALKDVKLNPRKKEYYLTDIIEILFDAGRKIETVETETPVEGLGVNTRADLAEAGELIRRRELRKWMLDGVTIEDPATTYIYAGAKIGRDTVIRPCTVIESDVRVGSGCEIGPFCRLRPGTRIANGVQVGNFSEISRTQIGSGSIMKHFGFLGDAVLGAGVNVGAGTVTANYDGKTKSRTRIRNGAFIGSDSVLIAPLTVDREAVTAAGSVVPKNTKIPPGSVVMGVPGKVIKKT